MNQTGYMHHGMAANYISPFVASLPFSTQVCGHHEVMCVVF